MHSPKVTVITVCFNCKSDIEVTLKSVTKQTYPNTEYIIIDGRSNDGTLDVIHKYTNEIDTLVSEPDQGIFDAMNKGLKHASGDWVNFMNAGDTFYTSNTLTEVFKTAHETAAFLYGSSIIVGEYIVPKLINRKIPGAFFSCHQSTFYNRNILQDHLYFKTKHSYYGDLELGWRLIRHNFNFKRIPIIISNYKGNGFSSVISNKARIAKFDYLYQNFGISGIFFGIFVKIRFLFKFSFTY